jgi:hypothetical protein
VPKPLSRDGDFFLAIAKETERTTIHVVAWLEGQKVERTLVISGYTANQVPCDRRTIYLAKKPFNITENVLASALRGLNNSTHCADIDKALVIWEAIRETSKMSRDSLPPSVKNISDLIEYNWARGNYQACISLGYEPQSETGETAFKNLSRASIGRLRVNPKGKIRVTNDMHSMPLQIAYSRLQQLFAMRDYLAAAQAAEQLIREFDRYSRYWEYIRIPKSRLYADAAVSWLHYADNLTSISAEEKKSRCLSLERALANARNALWYDFRREHVPVIERKMLKCI